MYMMTNGNELRARAYNCEKVTRQAFSTLKENRHADVKMFNFGGLISSDAILQKNGLYTALILVLARYYDQLDKMEKIDNFIDKYSDIEYKEFNELSEELIEEILDDFDDIVK